VHAMHRRAGLLEAMACADEEFSGWVKQRVFPDGEDR
jgi:hypothetical protein